MQGLFWITRYMTVLQVSASFSERGGNFRFSRGRTQVSLLQQGLFVKKQSSCDMPIQDKRFGLANYYDCTIILNILLLYSQYSWLL